MSTTRLPEIAPYRLGDLAKIPCDEPDPMPDWAATTEGQAHGIRSIRLNGQLIACFGYVPITRHEVDCFAVIDRQACAGIGSQVAQLIRQQSRQWVDQYGFTTVTAACAANDRAARVFLRAIGYRESRPFDGDTVNFILSRSK